MNHLTDLGVFGGWAIAAAAGITGALLVGGVLLVAVVRVVFRRS